MHGDDDSSKCCLLRPRSRLMEGKENELDYSILSGWICSRLVLAHKDSDVRMYQSIIYTNSFVISRFHIQMWATISNWGS